MIINVVTLEDQLRYSDLIALEDNSGDNFFQAKIIGDDGITVIRCKSKDVVKKNDKLLAIKVFAPTKTTPRYVEVVKVTDDSPKEDNVTYL